MNEPTNRARDRRDAGPSTAEIAELTRRLRELSTPGRNPDAAERAAFLADKDALLARITDTTRRDTDTDDRGEMHRHQAHTNRAAAADAVAAGWGPLPAPGEISTPDPGRPQLVFDPSGRETTAGPPMPGWMREQASRTQAETAAGTAAPLRTDVPAELLARVEALRAQVGSAGDGEDRREQLARWHHDDHTTTDADRVHDDSTGAGWGWSS